MFDHRLPEQFDPLRFAEGKRELQGRLSLRRMERLGAYLERTDGDVQVDLRFGIDEEGIRFIRGKLRTEVALTCQRCLGELLEPIDVEFRLGVVSSEAFAERLPAHYEPLVFRGEPQNLSDLVEDELILALPIVPRHADPYCSGDQEHDEPEEQTEGEPKRENPFEALAVLKINRKS